MELTISTQALQESLDIVTKLVPRRSVTDAHKRMLITADQDGLTISTNDDEIAAYTTISSGLDIRQDGCCAVLAKDFTESVQSMMGDEITLEASRTRLSITSPPLSKIEIGVSDPRQLSQVKSFLAPSYFRIHSSDLVRCIQQTAWNNESDGKFVSSNINLELRQDGTSYLVSMTQTTSMVKAFSFHDNIGATTTLSELVPAALMSRIRSAIGKYDGDVDIAKELDGNNLQFRFGETVAWVSTSTGRFVPWQKYPIDTSQHEHITIEPKRANQIVRGIKHLIDQETRRITLSVEGAMIIAKAASAVGTGQHAIDVERDQDESRTVDINAQVLANSLSNATGESILHVLDRESPVVIESEGCEFAISPMI